MNESMNGKKVIVTGASSGIGRATAGLFLSRGAQVALVGRNEGPLVEFASLASLCALCVKRERVHAKSAKTR